jgi:hypothetical protein
MIKRQPYFSMAAASMLAVLFVSATSFARDGSFTCGMRNVPLQQTRANEISGKHITARGTLRILIVFASFPDDTTSHPYWPVHQPPDSMRHFIDPDTLVRSPDPFNLTRYFREMSLNQFHLVGDVIWVESARSQDEYLNGSFGRANTDIIKERLDALVDFSQYDNWTRIGDYQTAAEPDSVVDMIVMVWRTTLFQLYGEASLGYKPAIAVDGKRIAMGYPESFVVSEGSGITCEYPYADDPSHLSKTIVHELSHWLLGGAHPYSSSLAGKHQYWGMMCAGQRLSWCANAYERERLGWIVLPVVEPDRDLTLRDFLQTGDAAKFHPANGEPDEYFYLENHQHRSTFDDATLNTADNGLWILHQQHPYDDLDDFRIRPSDGNWGWTETGVSSSCFGTTVPAFQRSEPRTQSGPSHRDQIPTQSSAVNWMYALKHDTGTAECGLFLGGESFTGSFDTSSVALFSSYSNPNSNTWNNQPSGFCLEVVRNENGAITVHAFSNILEASPARRYLGIESWYEGGPAQQLPLAWGAQWSEGQPLESDVRVSTLQRRVDDGPWETVYEGASTDWVDRSYHYDSTGSRKVAFRVRVQDEQGKLSAWSNIQWAQTTGPTGIARNAAPGRCAIILEEPFPNPSNPSNDIGFWVQGVGGRVVRVSVYDLLGREVAVLVNGHKEPGHYTVRFDGTGLAAGVYIVQLVAGAEHDVKKIVLLR